MSRLIEALLEHGALGILSAALLVCIGALSTVCVVLWRRNVRLETAIYELAIDKVRSDEKVHGTLKAVLAQVNQLISAQLSGVYRPPR